MLLAFYYFFLIFLNYDVHFLLILVSKINRSMAFILTFMIKIDLIFVLLIDSTKYFGCEIYLNFIYKYNFLFKN